MLHSFWSAYVHILWQAKSHLELSVQFRTSLWLYSHVSLISVIEKVLQIHVRGSYCAENQEPVWSTGVSAKYPRWPLSFLFFVLFCFPCIFSCSLLIIPHFFNTSIIFVFKKMFLSFPQEVCSFFHLTEYYYFTHKFCCFLRTVVWFFFFSRVPPSSSMMFLPNPALQFILHCLSSCNGIPMMFSLTAWATSIREMEQGYVSTGSSMSFSSYSW